MDAGLELTNPCLGLSNFSFEQSLSNSDFFPEHEDTAIINILTRGINTLFFL